MCVRANILGARGFQHFASRISHVLYHRSLVVAVLHINFQYRNSANVFYIRINLHAVLPARQHFSKPGYAESRTWLAQRFLVCFAESRRAPIKVNVRFALVSKSAQKILSWFLPLQIAKPRHVNSYWLNGPAQRGFFAERWKFAVPAAAAHMRRQIVPEHTARICQPVRIFSRRGIKQNSRALLRLRAQNHYSRKNLARLFRVAVHIKYAPHAIRLLLQQ